MVRRGRLLVSLGAIALLSGCGRPATAPERPAAATDAGVGEASTAREASQAFAELRAVAKRRLAADRAAVDNRLGYEQSLARQRRDAEGTGMNERIPRAPIAADVLEAALAALVRESGGRLVDVRLGEAAAAKAVPATWDAEGPYPYEAAQLVARRPLAVELERADDAVLARVFEALRRADGPLLDLEALRVDGEHATFVGAVYQRREVAPPKHGVAAPSLEQLAAAAGVAVPVGHPRLGEVEAMVAEDRALGPDLAQSLATLSELDLESRVFQFYRERAKAVGSRAFAELTRAPAGP